LYQFPHRSFQEYLAACHLARFDYPDTLSRLARSDPNRWREVTLLAAARSKATPTGSIWELVEELCARVPIRRRSARSGQRGAVGRAAGRAGAARNRPRRGRSRPAGRHERKRRRVRDWQLRLLRSTLLPARERALAGDLLAALGETRQHLLDVDQMRFALRAARAFWMGDEGVPTRRCTATKRWDDYWIAVAPVTVAQFAQFVAASAYRAHDPDALRHPPNRPVVEVSWHDALRLLRLAERALARRIAGRLGCRRCRRKPSGRKPRAVACRSRRQRSTGPCRTASRLTHRHCRTTRNRSALGRGVTNGMPERAMPRTSVRRVRRAASRGAQPVRLRGSGRQRLGMDAQPLGNRLGSPISSIPTMPGTCNAKTSLMPDDIWRVVRGGSWTFIITSPAAPPAAGSHPGDSV
jgi:hypothetical protein